MQPDARFLDGVAARGDWRPHEERAPTVKTSEDSNLIAQLREFEKYLERIESHGGDIREARLQLSARILLHELHDADRDLSMDRLIEVGTEFMKEAEK
jgi:hypothetical protein